MQRHIIFFFFFFEICFNTFASVTHATIARKQTFQISNSSHIGFPSIVRLPNDSLMVVYRKGTSHAETSGRIMLSFGSPDGVFWSVPTVLINTAGIDDRDPSISLLNDGRIMLTYYTHIPGSSLFYPPVPTIFSLHVAFSSDGGQTFSVPVSIDGNTMTALPAGSVFEGAKYILPDGETFQTFAATSSAVEIENRIIIPAYGGDAMIGTSIPGVLASAPTDLYFFESTDMGLSWSKQIIAETYITDVWKAEPVLEKLSDGRFLMHYRCAETIDVPGSIGPMRQASFDESLNGFLPDQDFSFVGQGTDLIRLNCGVLVSGFRHVNSTPYSADVCMIYSIDEGNSWSDTIRVFQGTADCGYPSFIELSPNKLLVVYYTSGGSSIKATLYDIKIKLKENYEDAEAINYSSINEAEPFTMSMYPNPCRDLLTVSVNSSSNRNVRWSISDASGRVMRADQVDLVSGQQSFQLNLEGLPAGNYFITMAGNENSVVLKLVVIN